MFAVVETVSFPASTRAQPAGTAHKQHTKSRMIRRMERDLREGRIRRQSGTARLPRIGLVFGVESVRVERESRDYAEIRRQVQRGFPAFWARPRLAGDGQNTGESLSSVVVRVADPDKLCGPETCTISAYESAARPA